MKRAFKHLSLGIFVSISLFASAGAFAAGQDSSSVRAAAVKIMQAKLGPLRGTIPITARKTLLTRQMIEQLKPIPQSKLTGSPGIDLITTNGVGATPVEARQSFPVMNFNDLISGN